MTYLWLKTLHILSAMVLVGTGAGIAFFMLMASRTRNVQHIAATARTVILADWCFTAPAVLIQLITGIALMGELSYSFQSLWFYWVMGLFVFIGCCWLPVVWIQYRLKELAENAVASEELPPFFYVWMRRWFLLGIPAFVAILSILYLMVFKPVSIS